VDRTGARGSGSFGRPPFDRNPLIGHLLIAADRRPRNLF
jgi:hypothetical protein